MKSSRVPDRPDAQPPTTISLYLRIIYEELLYAWGRPQKKPFLAHSSCDGHVSLHSIVTITDKNKTVGDDADNEEGSSCHGIDWFRLIVSQGKPHNIIL